MTDDSVALAALRTVRANPRLLAFPGLGLVVSLAAFPVLVWLATGGVGAAVEWLVVAVGLPLLVVLPVALYLGIAAVVAVVAATLGFCNAGVVDATDRLRREEAVSVRGGLSAAVDAAPAILVYAAFAGVAGPTFLVLERGVGAAAARIFDAAAGAPYVVMTYLVGPVAVLEDPEPTGTFSRSAALLRSRFGPLPVVSLSVLEVAVLVGATPLVVVQTAALVDGLTAGSVLAPVLLAQPVLTGGVLLGLLWTGVVLGGALGAIAKTALYVAIEEDLDTLPVLDLSVAAAVDVAGPDRSE